MGSVSIACPCCGLSKQVPHELIPEGLIRVTCPQCRQSFVLEEMIVQEDSSSAGQKIDEPATALPEPVPDHLPPPADAPPPSPEANQEWHFSIPTPSCEPPFAAPRAAKPAPTLPSAWQLFRLAAKGYRRRAGALLFLVSMSLLPYLALSLLLASLKILVFDVGVFLFCLGAVILLIVAVSFWGTAAAVCAVQDEKLTIRQSLQRGWQRFGSFVRLSLLQVFIICGGYLLMIIPGVFLTVCFFFAQFVMIGEGERGMRALLKSREYVRGYFRPLVTRLVPIWAIPVLLGSVPQVGWLLSLFCLPFSLIYTQLLYRELRGIKGSVRLASGGWQRYKWICLPLLGYLVLPFLALQFLEERPEGAPHHQQTAPEEAPPPGPGFRNLLKLHDAFSRRFGLTWNLKAANLGPEQYHALLAQKKVAFRSGAQISVGPAAILYGGFSSLGAHPTLQLIIRVAQIPNLDLDGERAIRLVIEHVWDRNNDDRLVELPHNGRETKQGHMLIKRDHEPVCFETRQTVNLSDDSAQKDVAAIQGRLELALPVRIRTLKLDASMVGVPTQGVTLQKLARSQVTLEYQGTPTNFLKLVGYDAQGNQVAEMAHSEKFRKGAGVIKASFIDEVHSLRVFLASDFVAKSYPFILREPEGGFASLLGLL